MTFNLCPLDLTLNWCMPRLFSRSFISFSLYPFSLSLSLSVSRAISTYSLIPYYLSIFISTLSHFSLEPLLFLTLGCNEVTWLTSSHWSDPQCHSQDDNLHQSRARLWLWEVRLDQWERDFCLREGRASANQVWAQCWPAEVEPIPNKKSSCECEWGRQGEGDGHEVRKIREGGWGVERM